MKFRNAGLRFGAMHPMFAPDGTGGGSGEGSADEGGSEGSTDSDSGSQPNDDGPTVEELLAKISDLEGKNRRLKNASDNASAEASKYKKQYRESLSAQERENAERQEEVERRDAEYNEMKTRLAKMDTSKKFMSLGLGEEASDNLAQVYLDGDLDAVINGVASYIESVKKNAVQDFLKERPEIAAGVGGSQKESSAEQNARRLMEKRKSTRGVNADILSRYK